MNSDKEKERRRAKRHQLQTDVEFFVDADIIKARSINISDGGIQFETETPITIFMRMEVDGKMREYEAQLVWATRKPDGSMAYGFKYLLVPE
ncbi:MAG: PilZ domain-containing protein [bacterium]|nr:PilZ domain-containing protein [bacterium]